MEFVDLKKQYKKLKKDIDKNISNVLNGTNFIMGPEVKELETKMAEYVGTKYCITCANGTDALQLALMTLDIGKNDAVFVPTFTFYASAEVISLVGAQPIFVDTDERTFNIDVNKLEAAIKKVIENKLYKPRAIIAVDLFGQPADYPAIKKIAEKYNLIIIEDGAQGFGGSIGNERACSFGDISTTSFFPAKPLGCYGDGGAIFTNDEGYYEKLQSLRVHGKGQSKYDNIRIGLNSRLDTIQAAILLPKFACFKEYELDARNDVAKKYTTLLSKYVKTPYVPKNYLSSWAQYTIILNNKDERDYLQLELKNLDIPSMVYYPKSLHLQTAYSNYDFNLSDLKVAEATSDVVLSLPMHPYLSDADINIIGKAIIKILEGYRNDKR